MKEMEIKNNLYKSCFYMEMIDVQYRPAKAK